MKYILIASVLAATGAHAALDMSSMPPCALPCAVKSLPKCLDMSAGISDANKNCICDTAEGKNFQLQTATCVQSKESTCSAADQCKLYKAVLEGCGGISDKIPVPAGCDVKGAAPAPGSGSGSSSAAGPPATQPTTTAPAAGGANPPPSSSTEAAPVPTSSAVASEVPSGSAAATYGAPAPSTVATSASSTANSTSAPVASGVAVGAASANAVNGVVALVAGLVVAFAL